MRLSRKPLSLRDLSLFFSGLVILSLFIFGVLIYEKAVVANFCRDVTESTYEQLNPLRRLDAGQIPGHDFQNFHGLGLVFAHYPLYVILGRNLFASEISQALLSPIVFIIAQFLFLRMLFRHTPKALFFTALTTIAGLKLYPNLINPMGVYASLGARTAMPVINAAIAIWLFQSHILPERFIHFHRFKINRIAFVLFVLSFCVALSFFISPENGIASVAAFITATVLLMLRSSYSYPLKFGFTLLAILGTIFFTILLFIFSSGKYFLEPIQYALVDIPNDQFWYTGVFPNQFFQSVQEILSKPYIVIPVVLGLILLGIILRMMLRSRINLFGQLFLILYGLFSVIPLLGYYDFVHVMPLIRVETLVGIWLMSVIAATYPVKKINMVPKVLMTAFKMAIASVGIILIAGFCLIWEYKSLRANFTLLANAQINQSGRVYFSGVYLCDFLHAELDTFSAVVPQLKNFDKVNPQVTFWSNQQGMEELALGTLNPAGDWISHAVGPNRRRQYITTFKKVKPTYINLFRYPSTSLWEDWYRFSHWEYYEAILRYYQPVALTPAKMLWEKTTDDWTDYDSKWDGIINGLENKQVINIPLDTRSYSKDDILIMKVHYTLQNPWGSIPYLGRLPRYFLYLSRSNFGNAISLPPYQDTFEFPYYLEDGKNPEFRLGTVSLLPGVSFSISEVWYRLLNLLPDKKIWFFN